MTIALTGAGGSIGRALVACAALNGNALTVFPTRTQLDLAGPLEPLKAWLAVRWPDAIIHLAGRRHGGDAAAAVRDNVAATYNLLEAVASLQRPVRVVVASSADVYGDARGRGKLAIGAERRPMSVYGVSKALQEDTCTLARASHGTDVSVARIFNIFGAPGDTWSVIPNMIARIGASADGATLHVTNARCVRDFVHIDDVCSALLLASTQPSIPRVFNIATGIETAIGDIARRIAESLHRNIDLRFDDGVDATTILDSIGDPEETIAMGWKYRAISNSDIRALSAYSAAG